MGVFVEGHGHVVFHGIVEWFTGAAILNNLTIKFIVPLERAYPRGALVRREERRG